MNNDPADLRASSRARLGLTRELNETRAELPDPAKGGTRGYPVADRLFQLAEVQHGRPVKASRQSISRWMERLHPYRMTGNQQRKQVVGVDQLTLVVYISIHPDATLDEMATFIYNEGGGIYSITKKASSTEAYQAFTPQNVLKVQWFWTRAPPLGVYGVPRRKFIDVDEFGVALERTNRKYAWAVRFFRVRKPGHYTRNTKLTVL